MQDGVGDYERLVLYNQCCCPLSVSVRPDNL
ncbi:hypothetical protein T4B_8457 [Trichinella pseudospiralis]|uniref:Uncharacterized protein n=1 Tax=Trichinella pseudospiralis TaxID=6337 RepID=A0A0V1GPM1_TRIPS|nr:hypothetical protein T4C_2743 [Trichinella pseudospiralis]KRY97706.1 hypothetical protein T4B_4722 [Trichinella pseudospiralis]KRY97707.1 hypothetical protein T4B_8457 [Trichinella pseudospiralis]KRZ00131.1 hypothetical protein T4C_2716 [Trichinella pseudospiralis]KRZ00138.1 hypothetical protein T4C_3144 [Trichinella pseudospiralis]